ncbi:MAG: peroxiredoxin family protein, partial [candidate division Zixibacteria bacterium]|nr:peroxiredoxin family protein [candidate division Zixibacteria bacterium]
MSDKSTRTKKKFAILVGLGIIAAAFVGLVAGNEYVGWRLGSAAVKGSGPGNPHEVGLLKAGEMFPDVELFDLEGNRVSTHQFIGKKSTVVMFMIVDCAPCTQAIDQWKTYTDTLSADLQLVGICVAEVKQARAYSEESDIPFALYCDTDLSFHSNYEISRFPSLVGLSANGDIEFMQ